MVNILSWILVLQLIHWISCDRQLLESDSIISSLVTPSGKAMHPLSSIFRPVELDGYQINSLRGVNLPLHIS